MNQLSSIADPQRGAVPAARRYAFVCGLHRSGTTLIARSLMEHPEVSGFSNTGVIEDEGQYLQTVLPLETTFGGAGRFGFDARAHLTEESVLNTPAVAAKLASEWGGYWDSSKPVLLEKTPSNLLRMRLLQRLFQPSSFIIVTRHPIATSLATLKWTEGNLFSLFCHWVHSYRLARADASLVDRTLWLSYEAFVADPRRQLERLSDFLGLAPRGSWDAAVRDQNSDYFARWRTQYLGDTDRSIAQPPPSPRNLLARARGILARAEQERSLPSHRRRGNLQNFHDALDAVALFEPAVREFGYSLTDLTQFPDS